MFSDILLALNAGFLILAATNVVKFAFKENNYPTYVVCSLYTFILAYGAYYILGIIF